MAFFSTPGMARLYSGVTKMTPSDFWSFSRKASQSAGGLAFEVLVEEGDALRRHRPRA